MANSKLVKPLVVALSLSLPLTLIGCSGEDKARTAQEARRTVQAQTTIIITMVIDQPIMASERARLQSWLKARYPGQAISLVIGEEIASSKRTTKRSRR